jgi:hypothetical protein
MREYGFGRISLFIMPMLYLFFSIVALMFATICVLVTRLKKQEAGHRQKIKLLREIILHLTENNADNSLKTLLADGLTLNLRHAGTTLMTDVADLQKELLGIIAEKNN